MPNHNDLSRSLTTCRFLSQMLMNPMGSIVLTNDGNAILREITVQHPAAKTMIEISRTQDEEVGDGTTSVIVLTGELLSLSQQYIEQNMHPTVIIRALRRALEDSVQILREIAIPVDVNSDEQVIKIINSCLGTKILGKYGQMACKLALDSVRTVFINENGRKEIDIKKYARIEKIPGGSIEDSRVLRGVLLNKDVVHAKMRRYIENPRVLLLDCNLEYKKGESQTEIEISKEEDFTTLLKMEEEYIEQMCADIIKHKPDLVITEKGVSDLAQHYLQKANISVLRRAKKTDNNRIARACGATIVNRTDEIKEEDIGKGCGVFEVVKIGDEYFSFINECKNPKACTILLRGPSKDLLNEIERNIQDALCVARNILLEPFYLPGGGCVEMIVGKHLIEKSKSITDVQQWPYRIFAKALEVIPRTLIQNCGGNTIRTLTALRAKHATTEIDSTKKEQATYWAINGETGDIVEVKDIEVWEPLSVKLQAYKTAIEAGILLLRIDDIISGSKKKDQMEKDEQNRRNMSAAPTEESQAD